MKDSVQQEIAADPVAVWSLVSDITRTSELAAETESAHWLDGATAPAVGARFAGRVNRNGWGVRYSTVCTVTRCEPGVVFEFGVGAGSLRVITWRYDFAPSATGTLVTESYRLSPNAGSRLYWALAGRGRARTNRRNMIATLQKVKVAAER